MTITVYGIPAPQGSKRPLGNGVMIESSKKVRPWREAVSWAIRDAGSPRVEGPVRVDITFTFGRPKKYAAPKHRNALMAVAPDGDKLLRSTWDALTQMRVIEDDSRIVRWSGAKLYEGADGALDKPGAVIEILPAGAGERGK